MDVHINFGAVVAAMLSSLLVGGAWYAPAGFGTAWLKLARIDTTKKRGGVWQPIVLTMAVSLITAYVLAHFTYLSNQFFHHSFLQDALSTAFALWLGLTACRLITHDAFEGRPAQLTLLNIGNEFVTLMIMGFIIGVFKV